MPSEVSKKQIVYAAGGLVVRPSMVLLVWHIDKGWELPKGRVESGETEEETALREVREETGYRCELQEKLPPIRYFTHSGQAKSVQFWVMHVTGLIIQKRDASTEAILWCSFREAIKCLRHNHEKYLVERYSKTIKGI